MTKEYKLSVSREQEPSDAITLPAHMAGSGALDRLENTIHVAASDNTLQAYAKD